MSHALRRIGPGRLILVVGPSGAGKDTLIQHARHALCGQAGVVFPRRIVTRPATSFEDHASLDESEFDAAIAEQRFAFWWHAHGLRYGVPASVDEHIRAGRSAVCNVSRTMVAALRQRYAHAVVVRITAPEHVLAARLAARGRTSDGHIADRLRRNGEFGQDQPPDFVIENVGDPERAAAELLTIALGRRTRAEFPAELP